MADLSTSQSNEMRPMLSARWRSWLLWLLASTAGWSVGGPMGVALGRSGDIIAAGFVGVAVGGIVTGILQWLVLRRQIPRATWWVPASTLAVVAVGAVVFGVGRVNADVGWIAGAGLFGAVVGLLQWLVLRRQVARAGWWVLASTLGWVVGGPLGWAGLGAVYGAMTASVLVWLLNQQQAWQS